MKNRVALLTNQSTPYRSSFYRELSNYSDLLVIFDTRNEPDREWACTEEGFRYTFTKGMHIGRPRKRRNLGIDEKRYLQIRYDILHKLYAFKPKVVVSAEMGLRTIQAAAYCKANNIPLIIWWEGTRHTEGWVKVKWIVRKLLVNNARRFWSNGRESTTLLLDYGASPATIDEGLISSDTHFFASESDQLLAERACRRSELALEGTVFLFVGRYIGAKGLHSYLKALDKLYKSGVRGWSTVFLGSGPLKNQLCSWQSEHPDVPVLVSDFVQWSDMPKFYVISDVFVLPTLEDNWSLVALEAAVCRVPQLFSVYNGCVSDLLYDERVGRIVDPLKVEELAAALSDYVQNPPPRIPAELVQQFVDRYSPEQVAARAWTSISACIN